MDSHLFSSSDSQYIFAAYTRAGVQDLASWLQAEWGWRWYMYVGLGAEDRRDVGFGGCRGVGGWVCGLVSTGMGTENG